MEKQNTVLKALKAAFPYTIPVFTGFTFLGISYGVLMTVSGFPAWCPILISLVVYGGSLQFAAVAMLLVSLVFSLIINQSANYPLVYGSLASLILLMLWLYSSCTVIYCGAAVNIVLRDIAGEDSCKQKDVQ